MKYFFDTEFHEFRSIQTGIDTIQLISIGIAAEDGRELYHVSRDFNTVEAFSNDWLRENVLTPIYKESLGEKKVSFNWADFRNSLDGYALRNSEIKNKILEFVGDDEKPEFYAYYGAYDWVVFCWLFGRMIDLPRGFPMYCRDLKQMLDQAIEDSWKDGSGYFLDHLKKHDNYPKQENEHSALDDARWNKKLYEFIKSL